MSSCRHRMRSAEQRWPALSNADASTSATTCSDSAELSTIIAFWPPVSATSTASSARSASVRLIALRHRGRAGEQDAGDARIGDQRRADRLAAPGQQLQRGRRHAGAMEEAHGGGGDQRRLLGGLGEHRIAGRQRGADLADENGQRKIPRRDARDRPQRAGAAEFAPRLRGVVAAEVGGLAHFADRVGRASCRLPAWPAR